MLRKVCPAKTSSLPNQASWLMTRSKEDRLPRRARAPAWALLALGSQGVAHHQLGRRQGILGGTSTKKTSVSTMSTKNSMMPVMTTDWVTASPTPAGPRLAVMPL